MATACGGSDESPAQEPAATGGGPTRAEYIAEADAFCADAAARHPEIEQSAEELRRTSPSAANYHEKAATHFKKVLKLAEEFEDEFRALEPPAADRERIEEFNRANEEAIDRLRELIEELEAEGDVDAAAEAYVEALAKADRLAEAYGFEVCARLPEESS